MSLNIKNESTHALVRELARIRGVSQTEAVDEAVRARLSSLVDAIETQRRFDRTMEISLEASRLLASQGATLTTDDLYDELGVPK